MSMAYPTTSATTAYYEGSSTTGTMWVDSATASGEYVTFYRSEPVEHSLPSDGTSITYDPETKKFVVSRGLDYADKEFTTKRSAKRYLKRWEDSQKKVVRPERDIYAEYKKVAQERRERKEREERRARERREQERRAEAMRIIRERLDEEEDIQNMENSYFERLGC